ncbi:MAG: GspE/PulE family protein [Lentisphaeraceae bacterium]|nr:GspE/PulE family protein [Lentisphaeraceae bacterium]
MQLGNGHETIESVLERLRGAERFEDAMWELESLLLEAFGAERFTIYQKDGNDHEIVSWYRTSNDAVHEIRVPLSPASVAGYCAMTLQPMVIDDAYDTDYLESVHPQLQFDHSFDGESGYLTEAMVVVPIVYNEKIYGVLQVINNVEGGAFPDDTYYKACQLSDVIAESFRYELRTSNGPFDTLTQSGLITIEQLEGAEKKALEEKVPISHVLRTDYEVPAEEMGEVLATYYQAPFHIYDENYPLDEDILNNLNISFLASNYWVPLFNNGERATILLSDPNNHELVMEIQNIIKAMNYEFHVGLGEDVLRYLGLDPWGNAVGNQAIADIDTLLEGDEAGLLTEELGVTDDDELDSDQESKIIQLVNKIIIRAVQEGASDIHIEPMKGKTPGEVRMRVDGICRKVFDIPATLMRPVVARVKILSNLDIAERRKPQDGKMTVKLKGKPLELRVATLPVVNGESAVMRILAQGGALPFDALKFSEANDKKIHDMIAHPHGMVLVVGPTGSGKTTTLHAILAILNTEERKILTAEDPVEITQKGLQQVQVLPKAGLTFASAMRSFLRCDPDVILIGEMRDEETCSTAIEASLTGHLVFSTLHTNSAPETIIRLLDIGLDPMNFADALVGIVAQRLVRTLCSKCKQPYKPEEDELTKLKHYYGEEQLAELDLDWSELELMKPSGCEKCGQTGYRGRMGLHEILLGTKTMKGLVSKSSPIPVLRDQAIVDGMRTLQQDGIAKIFAGHTDLVQVRRVALS